MPIDRSTIATSVDHQDEINEWHKVYDFVDALEAGGGAAVEPGGGLATVLDAPSGGDDTAMVEDKIADIDAAGGGALFIPPTAPDVWYQFSGVRPCANLRV